MTIPNTLLAADEMTPEQRKRVADICGYKRWPGHEASYPWLPSFVGPDWQRSQALAVVEWIRDKLPVITAFPDDRAASTKYESAFKSKDIESLLSLVLELSDE